CVVVERPSEAVLHIAGPEILRLHLPEFLDADAELLRFASLVELEVRDEPLGQRAAHALGDQHILAVELHARLIIGCRLAVPADAHDTSAAASHRSVLPPSADTA